MSLSIAEARRLARERGDFDAITGLVPYAGWLGIQMQHDDALPSFTLPFVPMLVGNPRLPAIHGGVTAAFMETAALLHLVYVLDETRVPKSIDFSIDYLRSGQCLDSHARCEVTRLGRRVAQVQICCWQADSARPVALARAHFLLTADLS